MRQLVLELRRRPASIAEGDQAFARALAEPDIAQNVRRDGERHAAVDVERVVEAIFGAVDDKAGGDVDRAPRNTRTLSVMPLPSAPNASSKAEIGRLSIGRLTTMPNAPSRLCCASRMTA